MTGDLQLDYLQCTIGVLLFLVLVDASLQDAPCAKVAQGLRNINKILNILQQNKKNEKFGGIKKKLYLCREM